MMELTDQSWVIEWSHKQQCFHVDTLSNSMRNNRQNYYNEKGNDYIPLLVCESIEEASRKIEALKLAKSKAVK